MTMPPTRACPKKNIIQLFLSWRVEDNVPYHNMALGCQGKVDKGSLCNFRKALYLPSSDGGPPFHATRVTASHLFYTLPNEAPPFTAEDESST